MIINSSKIMKDARPKTQIGFLSVFAMVGFLLPFWPLVVIREINTNSIISFFVLLALFGIPFGYFIGLRNIITTYRMKKHLENENFTILIDSIEEKSTNQYGRTSQMDDSFCVLQLKKYYEKTQKQVTIRAKEFRQVKEGDQCILIFVPSSKAPILVYPGNQYTVADELIGRVVE